MKKVIAMLLCAVIAFSLVVPAFADTGLHYTKYLPLGDSVTAGKYLEDYRVRQFRFTQGSYPQIIRDAVADPALSVSGSHGGMRVAEMLVALGLDEYADDYTYKCFDTTRYDWGGIGYIDQITKEFDYRSEIADADLITVNFGSNDLAGVLVYHVKRLLETLELDGRGAIIDKAIARAEGDEMELLVSLLKGVQGVLGTGEAFFDFCRVAVKNVMDNGLTKFLAQWDVLMEQIYALNDDVEVAVVGIYNPTKTILIDNFDMNETAAGILAEIVQPLVDLVNYKMKTGSRFRDRYVYVDMSELERTGVPAFSSDGAHPSLEGHRIMAELILDALSGACHHEHTFRFCKLGSDTGYTGDVFCSDCGRLVERGTFVTASGKTLQPLNTLSFLLIRNLIRLTVNLRNGIQNIKIKK